MQKQGENVFTRTVRGGRQAWRTFAGYRATTIAGTLVFFLIMSLVPFLFWLTLLFGGAEGLFEKVMELELFGWARDLLTFLRDNQLPTEFEIQLSAGGGQFLTVYSGTVSDYGKPLRFTFRGGTASDLRVVLNDDRVSVAEIKVEQQPK